MKFRTHTGEIVTGPKLATAVAKVAQWYTDNAYAVRDCGDYASHVTEETKDEILQSSLDRVTELLDNGPTDFSSWQRVNLELTGECPAFLP